MQRMINTSASKVRGVFLFLACVIITSFSNSLNVQAHGEITLMDVYSIGRLAHSDIDPNINELEVARQLFIQAFKTLDEHGVHLSEEVSFEQLREQTTLTLTPLET